MFIAIDAKADIEGSKKGKLTPAQHAQINSWVFSKKTGILDCFDKCDTTDISYTAVNNIATVIFKKGFIVICGRLVECEQGTEVKIQTPVSGSVSGRIVLRFSLSSTQEEEFKVVAKTGRSLTLNDLNENSSTGVYEFPLYDYIATPNNVSLMNKNISYVSSMSQEITALSGMITSISNSIEGNKDAPLYDYNKNKGTIEQRLTNLGFKQGSITGVSGATLTKQGKYAILTIPERAFVYTANEQKTTTLTMSFTSASKIVSYIIFQATTSSAFIGNPYEITIEGNKITFTTPRIDMSPMIFNRKFNIGFEISSW